ncbi:MAG: hypothetical protein WCY18_00995 [Methanofastidiosum sp.]
MWGPWGISQKQQPEWHIVVIARTESGKKLLENAAKDGAIILEELSIEDIFRGQTVDGRHKIKFYTSRDIYNENKWIFPFSKDSFVNINYAPVNKKIQEQLNQRRIYTHDVYMTKESEDYLRKISLKKKKIEGNLTQKLKKKIIHIGGFILRKVSIIN